MELPQITRKPPTGWYFEIAGLMLLQGWGKVHGVRMVVELDHWVEDDEFYAQDSSLRYGIPWRSATDIVAQPLIDRASRLGSIADARNNLLGISRIARVAVLYPRPYEGDVVLKASTGRHAGPSIPEKLVTGAHRGFDRGGGASSFPRLLRACGQ